LRTPLWVRGLQDRAAGTALDSAEVLPGASRGGARLLTAALAPALISLDSGPNSQTAARVSITRAAAGNIPMLLDSDPNQGVGVGFGSSFVDHKPELKSVNNV
jgi:hypothetical protein